MTPTERLEEKLEEAGFRVRHISGAKGFWRTQDCYRWDASAVRISDGVPVSIGSYSTITDCARKPIKIVQDERYPREYYVKPVSRMG
jgi:hypothetical protein